MELIWLQYYPYYFIHENHDIAIALSSSSRADTDSVLAGGI